MTLLPTLDHDYQVYQGAFSTSLLLTLFPSLTRPIMPTSGTNPTHANAAPSVDLPPRFRYVPGYDAGTAVDHVVTNKQGEQLVRQEISCTISPWRRGRFEVAFKDCQPLWRLQIGGLRPINLQSKKGPTTAKAQFDTKIDYGTLRVGLYDITDQS